MAHPRRLLVRQHTPSRSGSSKTWPVALALAFLLTNLFSFSVGRLDQPGLSGGTAQAGQAMAAPRPDGGGQAVLGRPVTGKRAQLPWSKTPPTPSAQERQAQQAAQAAQRQLKVPVGPIYHMTAAESAALRRTAGPPLPTPGKAAHAGPLADSDFDLELNQAVSSGGFCGSCNTTPPLSPSVANDGQDLWVTGNNYSAISTDNGSTWSAIDPVGYGTVLGLAYNGRQQVLYEPSRDLFFWSMEGFAGYGSSMNGIGLVTVPGNLSFACLYTFFPPAFGLPTGDWLYQPDIEYSANYLYLRFDAFSTSSTFGGSFVARLPLSPMAVANGCGSVTPTYVSRTDNYHFTLSQGTTNTMYWLSNDYLSGPTTGNHVRVFFWPESSGSYTFQDKTIDPFNFLNSGNCASQDAVVTNWCQDANSTQATLYRSRAGYRGFGAPLLGMAWTAGPTKGINPLFPYIVRYYFLLANMAYKGHDYLYNPEYATAWPSLAAPVQRGYVGGTFSYGGGVGSGSGAADFYPANEFLIEDPDTPSQPWSISYLTETGNPGQLGDYNTARAWAPDGLHWITTANCNFTSVSTPCVVVFGRGRDHLAYLRWANT